MPNYLPSQVYLLAFLFTLLINASTIPTPVKQEKFHQNHEQSTCTPTSAQDAGTDDVPAIEASFESCGVGGTIVIPSGITYNIRSSLSLTGCVSCTFQIDGTLKASNDLNYWATQKAIIYIDDITGAKIYSSTGNGLIDGNGQASYDEFAANSSLARPTLFLIASSSGIAVSNLHFRNAPNVFHSVNANSKDVVYSSLTMSAASTSTNAPKNTDGWDIGPATNVMLDSVTVSNQDDCVAFKAGANYVTVTDISCTGSHGLSVGSLGSKAGVTDTVENIYVSGATMIDSTKAVGIKLYPGGSSFGSAIVKNVTWTGVIVNGSEYAAQIQSCYSQNTSYCAEYPSTAQISDTYFKSFSGQTSTAAEPVIAMLDCPADGTCDIYFEDWSVKPPSGIAKYLCANIDSNLGATCASGAIG